jgi:hypothetical protein
LNNRFKFGHDNTTGALLLFAFHNVLFIPKNIRMIILQQFICSIKSDASFIRAWSLIHAIHCSNPGKFMDLLASENDTLPRHFSLEASPQTLRHAARRKNCLLLHQYSFAREINDSIIASSVSHKYELCSSKTYQTIFKNFIQSGDLCTVENCLRSLGPPISSTIVLAETDYDERCPLSGELWSSCSLAKLETYQVPNNNNNNNNNDNDNSVEAICKSSRYLHYKAPRLRALTQELLEKYHVKVSIVPSRYTKSNPPHHDNNYDGTRKHRRYF